MTESTIKNTNKKPAPRRRRARKSRRWPRVAAFTALVCVMVAIVAYMVLFSGSAPSSALVRIPAGASDAQVRDSLSRYLSDGYARKVMRLAQLRGADFSARHGAYLVEAGESPFSAMRRLTGGAQYPLTITINGFRLLPVLEEKVANRFDFSEEELASTLSDASILEPYGLTPDQAMALFINDSYEFYWNASPRDVVKKIGEHYLDVWNKERRDKAEALGLSPADVMTLASIVDEETNAVSEKGTVGRLYINRLRTGMPLQADPTVRYAVGDFNIKRITNKDKTIDSPYNTYRRKGLPPGPIRTTSVETIDAILDSAPNDYLYMCAKEDFSGRHNFASNYRDHQINARRYQRELDRRGIFR